MGEFTSGTLLQLNTDAGKLIFGVRWELKPNDDVTNHVSSKIQVCTQKMKKRWRKLL